MGGAEGAVDKLKEGGEVRGGEEGGGGGEEVGGEY